MAENTIFCTLKLAAPHQDEHNGHPQRLALAGRTVDEVGVGGSGRPGGGVDMSGGGCASASGSVPPSQACASWSDPLSTGVARASAIHRPKLICIGRFGAGRATSSPASLATMHAAFRRDLLRLRDALADDVPALAAQRQVGGALGLVAQVRQQVGAA